MMKADNSTSLSLSRKSILFEVFLFLLVGSFFCALSFYFYSNDFFHFRVVSYIEKARLAIDGVPPRLENIGFVYPPIPVLICAIFPLVWFVQGFVSSLVFNSWLHLARRDHSDYSFLYILLLAYFPFLYLAVFRFDMLLLFFLLFFSTYFLMKYWQTDLSLYLFIGGFLLGLSFFLNFSMVYMALVYGLAILLKRGVSSKEKIGVLIVYLAPMLFFVLFTFFVNYIFRGDPFYFMKKYTLFYLQDPLVVRAKSSMLDAIVLFLDTLKSGLFLVLPYFILLLALVRASLLSLSSFVLYMVPLLFLFLQIKCGMFFYSLSNFLPFLLFVLLFLGFLYNVRSSGRINSIWAKMVVSSVVVSVLVAPGMYLSSIDKNENNFVRALFGESFEQNLALFRNVADVINGIDGLVLFDDEPLFPVVLFVSDIKRLVLPYQYEYYNFLMDPRSKVDYIIGVIDSPNDDVYRAFPEIKNHHLDGCKYYRRVENVVIFKCNNGFTL